ncbi:MAG: 16S rRNA (cytosine(967)-C(5))-methyltransferase RsmB [Gammaproteobacteria bacterium]|nr:16S rRNA (cytosine(967)-C(5))-methyltransferase RsmB [Gammaproteobacteria bacterium]MCY4277072.1 16S rRNA (cytosine(967)-C(5))-methyltransferase RsmB [Gammaproteobacteria bacterium]MCY4323562.1 16S rRNA (cytosine(967)-C(5))-methyltransferase RsmB [Gammaproteobacteria bacterium]
MSHAPPAAPLPRLLAVRLLVKILRRGLPFDQALLHEHASPFVHELLYGVLRHYFSLSERVSRHLRKPLRAKDFDIFCLLLTGVLQIHHMRTPAHAAVNESVGVVRRIGKPWAVKLINAVLRAVACDRREPEGIEARFDHPGWLIEHVRTQYPQHWREMLSANLTRAPLCLRVNTTKTTRDAALDTLQRDGIAAVLGAVPSCIVLEQPRPSAQITGLASGEISVQDQGAQLAALLLDPCSGMRVLDACAAPGNKTSHLLEHAPGISLTSVDQSEMRLQRIDEECARLGLPCPSIINAPLEELAWWDGQAFDAVLLDVPCSGTGTLRRHPDIKVLARADELESNHQRQTHLLDAAWRTLKPGGKLLYSTCSMLQRENEDIVRAKSARADAVVLGLPQIGASGLTHVRTGSGAQLITTPQGPDAMFYALLGKRA